MIREHLEHRPFLVIALACALGVTALSHPLNGLLAAFLLWFVRPWRVRGWAVAGLAIGLILTPPPVVGLIEPKFVESDAKVISMPSRFKDQLLFDVRIGEQRFGVSAPLSATVGPWDTVHLRGLAKPIGAESRNSRDLSGRIDLREFESVILERGPAVGQWAMAWRNSFEDFARRTLPAEAAEFTVGVVFRYGAVDEETRAQLRRTGTLHLFAASGLHVLVLTALVLGVLSRLPIPLALRVTVLGAILVLYCIATGWHMPTVRASIGAMLYALAPFVGRVPDRLSALGLAAFGYLMLDPTSIYNPGFQLSATIVGFQALFLGAWDEDEGRFWREVKHLFWISLLAVVVGEPILALHTGEFSVMTIPANLLMVHATCLLMAISLSAHLIWVVIPLIGSWMMLAVGGIYVYLRSVLDLCDRVSLIIPVPELWPYWLVPYYGSLLASWRFRAKSS